MLFFNHAFLMLQKADYAKRNASIMGLSLAKSGSIFVVLPRWRSEVGGGGALQDSSILTRRPFCTQSLKYSIRISTGSSFSGRTTEHIISARCSTYCCAIPCCARCLCHGFVRKSRIVSSFMLCASRRRGDRPQRTFKSNNRVPGIYSYKQSRARHFTPI